MVALRSLKTILSNNLLLPCKKVMKHKKECRIPGLSKICVCLHSGIHGDQQRKYSRSESIIQKKRCRQCPAGGGGSSEENAFIATMHYTPVNYLECFYFSPTYLCPSTMHAMLVLIQKYLHIYYSSVFILC